MQALFLPGAEKNLATPIEARVPTTMRRLFPLSETFNVGADTDTPVGEDYRVPFSLRAGLDELVVTVE